MLTAASPPPPADRGGASARSPANQKGAGGQPSQSHLAARSSRPLGPRGPMGLVVQRAARRRAAAGRRTTPPRVPRAAAVLCLRVGARRRRRRMVTAGGWSQVRGGGVRPLPGAGGEGWGEEEGARPGPGAARGRCGRGGKAAAGVCGGRWGGPRRREGRGSVRGEGAESPAVPFPGGPRRRVAGGGGCLRWDFAGGRVFPGCGPKTGQFTLEVRRGGGGAFSGGAQR